jgi:DNA-binding transcriptional MerR regulator
MFLAELSQRTGIPVPSIKFYLREGLLPPGAAVTARKSEYGEEHVRRLRLVQAMLKVGGLTVGQAKDVLAVAEDPAFGRHERLGIAQYMLPPHVTPPPEGDADREGWFAIREELSALLAGLGWQFEDSSPALDTLTRAVATLRSLGYISGPSIISGYAEAMHPCAEAEYAIIEHYTVLEEAIEATIAYTVLYEPVLMSLRRLAHEDVSARRYKKDPLW